MNLVLLTCCAFKVHRVLVDEELIWIQQYQWILRLIPACKDDALCVHPMLWGTWFPLQCVIAVGQLWRWSVFNPSNCLWRYKLLNSNNKSDCVIEIKYSPVIIGMKYHKSSCQDECIFFGVIVWRACCMLLSSVPGCLMSVSRVVTLSYLSYLERGRFPMCEMIRGLQLRGTARICMARMI